MADVNPIAAQKPFEYARNITKPREWGSTLPAKDKAEIHQSAKKFEQMFVSDMMNYMFSDTDMTKTEFGGGPGEKMYQSLLTNEYGKNLANSGQLGITPTLENEMLRLQELRSNPRLADPANLAATTNTANTSTTNTIEADHDAQSHK